ncbi:MAG TPA: 2-C-methyl-D-erythritol 4-phosphate cytidylyltransferase [Longimicrobiaceae bacterium]|nr:2-C-methyl-D-erythritol 4-phosphate cytidylyltransferase [Longimicrobiaceae bacterium]
MSALSSGASSPEAAVRAGAVIVAAGAGRRLGGEVRKQYVEIAGEPVLLRAIRPFLRHPEIGAVVVVLPPEDVEDPPAWIRELEVTLAPGGAERGDSVWNGLMALPAEANPLLIHDGARPFVSLEVIERVLAGARSGGAIAAIRVADTIKRVDDEGRIEATLDRSRLWLAQTPQGFPREAILGAHRRARQEGVAATDDAALCERYGSRIRVVEGSPENIKITRPADLVLAEALARRLD